MANSSSPPWWSFFAVVFPLFFSIKNVFDASSGRLSPASGAVKARRGATRQRRKRAKKKRRAAKKVGISGEKEDPRKLGRRAVARRGALRGGGSVRQRPGRGRATPPPSRGIAIRTMAAAVPCAERGGARRERPLDTHARATTRRWAELQRAGPEDAATHEETKRPCPPAPGEAGENTLAHGEVARSRGLTEEANGPRETTRAGRREGREGSEGRESRRRPSVGETADVRARATFCRDSARSAAPRSERAHEQLAVR